MKKKDIKLDRINKDKEIILSTIRNNEGILSKDIAKLTGKSSRQVIQLLIALRRDNEAFSVLTDKLRKINLWYTTEHYNSPVIKPYADFDKEHEEWCEKVKSKKVVYNPWGK